MKRSLNGTYLENAKKPKYDIPTNLKCTICHKMLSEPKHSKCGCRFCKSCVEFYLNDGPKSCPGPEEECKETNMVMNENVINDYTAVREISNLIFVCTNVECGYETKLRQFENHLTSCKYAIELCSLCNINLKRKDKNNHETNLCIERNIKCQNCGIEIVFKLLEKEHLNAKSDNVCRSYVSDCPFNCGELKVNIYNHKKKCINRPRNCIYSEWGCSVTGLTKKSMKDHLVDDIYNHSILQIKTLNQLKAKVQQINTSSSIWEVTEFSKEIKKVKVYTQGVSKRSPIFSVSEFSYNYCLEIQFYEDYMGIFFCIAKSKYDAALQWPFRANITLQLINQVNPSQTITMKGIYDANDENNDCFFQRPLIKDKNKGTGFPKFIEVNRLTCQDISIANHSMANEFVVDDMVLIKCTVEMLD